MNINAALRKFTSASDTKNKNLNFQGKNTQFIALLYSQ